MTSTKKTIRCISLLLTLVLAMGLAVLPVEEAKAAAKPTISASGLSLPGSHASLTLGAGFSLRGKITASAGKITNVKAFLSQGGVKRFIYEAKPNAKTYDIAATRGTNGKSLNATMRFGQLTVGKWLFRLEVNAANGGQTASKVYAREFIVAQKITASGGRYPGNSATLQKNASFALRGVYTANAGLIVKVTGTITKDGGGAVASYTATPNSRSFNVNETENSSGKTMNQVLDFSNLAPGAYTLAITATGDGESTWGKKATYSVKRTFVVVENNEPKITKADPSPAKQTITATNIVYPKNGQYLPVNDAFTLKGIYRVNKGVIQSVQATLKNTDTGKTLYTFNAKPDTMGFDVAKNWGTNKMTMNQTFPFRTLKAAHYELRVTVKGDEGAVNVITRSFVIGKAPKLSANNIVLPTRMKKGSAYPVRGTYTVDVGYISKVVVKVTDGNGSAKFTLTFNYAEKDRVKKFDIPTKIASGSKAKFAALDVGPYKYWVQVTAKNGDLTTVWVDPNTAHPHYFTVEP